MDRLPTLPTLELGRDVRVAVQRVLAGRRAGRIGDALLPDDQVRPLGQPAGARLAGEPGEVVDALARVHDRALAARPRPARAPALTAPSPS